MTTTPRASRFGCHDRKMIWRPPVPSNVSSFTTFSSMFVGVGFDELRVGRTDAGDLNDHRLVSRFGEVCAARRLGVVAAGRESLQRCGIERVAIAEVPRARDDG